MDEQSHQKPTRDIVTPGMVLTSDPSLIPGRGAIKEGNDILSIFVGLKDIRGEYVNVVPLNGLYNPQIGDKIIGKIFNKTPTKWLVDINSKFLGTLKPQDAFKRAAKGRGYGRNAGSYRIVEEDMLDRYKVGDMVICKTLTGDRLSEPQLTTLGQELGAITNGVVMTIPPPKIPRVIGKKGSMIALIKNLLQCKIFVAQNGRIWLHGKTPDHERLIVEVIRKIETEAHTTGLTDRIKYYILQEKSKRGLE